MNFKFKISNLKFQNGFTIMEVVVATSIFAMTITMMLTLFNYTLRTQRRTEALRQVSQTVRNLAEFLAKEIRNGQVDYNIKDGQAVVTPIGSCPTATLSGADAGKTYNPSGTPITDKIGLINLNGERECIVYDSVAQKFTITKENVPTEDLTPPNVKITMARFYVRPWKDPFTDLPTSGSSLVEVQPMVSFMFIAQVTLPTGEKRTIPYQTSVSTSLYNVPNQ